MDTFVQAVRSPETGQPVSRTQMFEYRNDGVVTKAIHNGQATNYTYSPAGWVETIADWRGMTSTIGYTPSGAPANENRGSGAAVATRSYKPDGMPASQTWTARGGAVARAHTNIGYDIGGQRIAEDVAVVQPAGAIGASAGGHATWDYDLTGRLTAYTSPYRQLPIDTANPATTYTLDDGGNITRQTTTVSGAVRNDETNTYVAGQLRTRHAIDGIGVLPVDTTWTYNPLGEEASQTSTGGMSATANATSYDPAGHTRRVDDQTSQGLGGPNPTDVDYLYDGADHLVARIQQPATGAGATTLYFYWGNSTTLAEEADGAGATTARYLTDGATDIIGQHTWGRDTNGHRDANDTAGTWAWLLDDTNGNTATHLADDGTVLEQAAFDPYGRPETPGKGKAANAPGSSLGHQGALTDRTTGSVILGARQYDPTTARFTTPDMFVPASLDLAVGSDELTGNRYLFAAANPVAFYEDGHCASHKSGGSWRQIRNLRCGFAHFAESTGGQRLKSISGRVGTWMGVGEMGLAIISGVCPECAPATLPAAAALGGVGTAANSLHAVLQCNDGGAARNCGYAIAGAAGPTGALRYLKVPVSAKYWIEGAISAYTGLWSRLKEKKRERVTHQSGM